MSTLLETNQEGVKFIDARSASKLVNYSPDYVTRLAREGKISAVQAGRQWLVDADSLKLFTLEVQAQKRARAEKIREERKAELLGVATISRSSEQKISNVSLQRVALAKTLALAACLFLFLHVAWFSFEEKIDAHFLATGVSAMQDQFAAAILTPLVGLVQLASVSFTSQQSGVTGGVDESGQLDSASSDFQGVIVISEIDGSVEKINQIRDTFSDEVMVEMKGDDTGIITPVFKNRSGESYRFLLAPVNN